MLLFSSGTFTVDGITVFPDHADPNQYWYLPGPVGLETEADSTEPQFLLIMYAPDVAGTGIQGAGFLNVTLALKVSDETQSKIINEIRTQFPTATSPRLAPVPFDEGTVQIVALNLQGSGGATAALGTQAAVTGVLGASNPELFGNNDALFALTLSEEGATILEQAFQDGMTPVGGIYDLKFTGVLPALDVKITADMKRAYNSFSVNFGASAYIASAGIDATFETLRQDGVINVQVVSLSNDASTQQQEQWALNLFKDQIMSTWFAPSLSPTTEAAADASSVALPSTTQAHPATSSSSAAPHPTMGGPVASSAGAIHAPTPTPTPSPTPGAASSSSSSAAGASGSSHPAAPSSASSSAAKPAAPAAAANPIANAAGTAAAASSAASPFGVSLKLKYVSQDELKTVEIEFNEMSAVQRTYAPQGYFGLLLAGIDQSKHFLKVDGTDPFFNQFAVTVNPPRDFTGIGLSSAHVALDYGATTANPKHGEYVFDAMHQTQQVWSVFQGLIQQTSFTYTADYSFDPESGWQGEQLEYTLPVVTTENRLLTLDPYDFLGFLALSISPGRIDPIAVDRIEVAVQYTAPSGWQASQTFIVRSGAMQQVWKLRLADKDARTYSFTSNCYLTDGTLIAGQSTTSTAGAIVVSDPFSGALQLTFQPAYDPTAIKLAIVEFQYQDTPNGYNVQKTFDVSPNQPYSLRVPLIDRTQTSYQYRVTLLSTTNQQTQGAYITSTDPLVVVGA
ncbi:MAG TPA: hypothetical protein VGK84_02605 [Candidatus Tumulicola sp.]|jgi:hypothetical protein